MSTDPRDVRSLAVTTGDVVTAYEASRRSDRRPVLRVTPPFSGRMRARLHDTGPGPATREGDDRDPETGAVHVPPARFVDGGTVPEYPTPDDTEDALREDSEVEFSVERHRERHVASVEAWREAVAASIADSVVLRLDGDDHRVDVATLGDAGGADE
ncbi:MULTISPECIES: hypothetical protein [Halorussus]|uniref:hypothetical protein n=1 Tax=Halorussus TaxID=1070314 RepID=UPI000E213DF1|nr:MULTISPECIES: hypothetical protein [Halorussus]NHN59535.1 hypothetical protein [Halorussus sp. JP-T4]